MPRRHQTLLAFAVIALGCTTVGFPALAEPPVTSRPVGVAKATRSFERFAASWMDKMRHRAAEVRQHPSTRSEAASQTVAYRGYGEGFETELRATGHPSAPYVGILRYTERLYRCADADTRRCAIAVTTPVTEIFRFQNGGWVY